MTTPAASAAAEPTTDPSWSPLLVEIHKQANELDNARRRLVESSAIMDNLVAEAVDEGEKYRDIARAARRSTPWVQVVLRRTGIQGPRVRLMTTRAAEARRLDAEEATAAEVAEARVDVETFAKIVKAAQGLSEKYAVEFGRGLDDLMP